MRLYLFALVIILVVSCDIIDSPRTYSYGELSRKYCPDSSKYILDYRLGQGGWDGGRSSSTTILKAKNSFRTGDVFSYSNYDIDGAYWVGNDTVVVLEKFTEFISNGKLTLRDTIINDIAVKIKVTDPIDTSFHQKIYKRETSPNGQYELIVYRYEKSSVDDYYFLNISIINQGDSIPKFGNFYVSKFDFDCFAFIGWDNDSSLNIGASEACYHAFDNYLVKNRPAITYKVHIEDNNGITQRDYNY